MATYRINGFSFNRANVAGINGPIKNALIARMVAREREICTVETHTVLCIDGPFQGQTIELSEGSITATLSIKGWTGHYSGGRWNGTTGQPVNVIPDQTNLSEKQADFKAGKGFTAFTDLLGELAEDFSGRIIETIESGSTRSTQCAMDDFGFSPNTLNEFAGTYALNKREVPLSLQQKVTKSAKKYGSVLSLDTGRGLAGNAYFMDDFGDLHAFKNSREVFDAPYLSIRRRLKYSIGRTSYTIKATAESVASLRQKVIKAKRCFADKFVSAVPTWAKRGHQPAIEIQDSEMAFFENRTASPITADAPDAAIDAHIAALAAQDVAQVVATAQAGAAIEHAQATATACEAPASEVQELATVCEGEASQPQGVSMGSTSGSTPAPAPVSSSEIAGGGRGRQFQTETSASMNPDDFAGDISESLAVAAYSGTSFSPERRGASIRSDYAQTMAEDWAYLHAQAVKGGTLDQLPAEFARYRASMAGRYRAWLASSSRCVSSFIAGPSNFPAARMNKRADIAHKRLTECVEGREMARRAAARKLRPDLRAIMAGDADATDRLAAKIAAAQRNQDNMKAANKAIRTNEKHGHARQVAALLELGYTEAQAIALIKPDYCGRVGFPSYSLTNNNANIRRMKERLAQIEAAQASEVTQTEGADGVQLEDDAPSNRVRLYFPGKPSAEIRDTLKSSGFRWAPSIGAWQAYRNYSSLQTAQQIAGTPAPAPAEELAPAPAAPVEETTASPETSAPEIVGGGEGRQFQAETVDVFGRRYGVVASFPESEMDKANEFMSKNKHTGCIAIEVGTVFIVDLNDEGKPTPAPATQPAATMTPEKAPAAAPAPTLAITLEDFTAETEKHGISVDYADTVGGLIVWATIFKGEFRARISDKYGSYWSIEGNGDFDFTVASESLAYVLQQFASAATLPPAPTPLLAPETAPAHRQQAASKFGTWTAQLYKTAGAFSLDFMPRDTQAATSHHATGRDRMATLQALAREADKPAQTPEPSPTAPAPASEKSQASSVTSPEPIQPAAEPAQPASASMAPAEASLSLAAIEQPAATGVEGVAGSNLISAPAPGALSITITRAEGPASECGQPATTVASFAQADTLLSGWANSVRKGSSDKCDFVIHWPDGGTYSGTYDLKHPSTAPASLAQHLIDIAEYMLGKFCPLHLSEADYRASLKCVSPEAQSAYTEILAMMADMGAYSPKARPAIIDPQDLIAHGMPVEDLAGLGVIYCSRDDSPAPGAIVAAKATQWGLKITVRTEDGIEHHAGRQEFRSGLYRVDFKRHGAPYLAQLDSAAAMRKARDTSAAELAKQAHASALATLATEYSHLQQWHEGGKLSGVTLAAANVRILLKRQFPGIKFSVKSSSYSMGNSLSVRWTDGPTAQCVDDIVGLFSGGNFDGMTDSYKSTTSAFTELFGSAKHTDTSREASDALVQAALDQHYEGMADAPTVTDYRNCTGRLSWEQGSDRRHFDDTLSTTTR